MITDYLAEKEIPFSDVGLGILEVEGKPTGAVRVTSESSRRSDHLNSRIFSEEAGENEFVTNIQIADLNAFNGILADHLQEGVLYISMEYFTAIHLCKGGCRNQVLTPSSPTDWKMTFEGKSISLYPSIRNWNFDCRSHYWIKE